jgi:hypothetical protein
VQKTQNHKEVTFQVPQVTSFNNLPVNKVKFLNLCVCTAIFLRLYSTGSYLHAKILAADHKLSTQQQPLLSKLQTSKILVVVAADGEYLKQFNTLQVVFLSPGQLIDVLVHANQAEREGQNP